MSSAAAIVQPVRERVGQAGQEWELDRWVHAVSGSLRARSTELVDSMVAAITTAIDDLGDSDLEAMLGASVEGNVATILQMLDNDIPLDHVTAPIAAREYALRLARAEVPVAALRRAYHIGSDDLLAHFYREIEALEAPAEVKLLLLRHLAGWLHRYVDWVTAVVIELHEEERAAVRSQVASHVSHLVHRVVRGELVERDLFYRGTGHRLEQWHRAAIIWRRDEQGSIDDQDRWRDLLAALGQAMELHSAPFAAPVEGPQLWVWFGLGDRPEDHRPELGRMVAALESHPRLRVALGAPQSGVAGFRRSFEQARAVRGLQRLDAGEHPVLCHDEDGVAAATMLARDLPTARAWVAEALGALARAGESEERSRETLRVFLGTGSLNETALRLQVHRNTVRYRIAKAEKERGRPLDEGRLDLELALRLCHLLGAAVLHPSEERGRTTSR